MYLDSGGEMKLKDIAVSLGLGDTQVRKWKSIDKWDDKLKGNVTNGPAKPNSNVTKRKPGAPPGNQFAVGNKGGPPKGSKNALGNRGGDGGPPGNKKAVTTGEFETIWLDTLEEDELELVDRLDTDPTRQVDEAIMLLTIRERRMMQRIKKLTDGLTEKQRRVLQERRMIKDVKTVHDEKSGKTEKIVVPRDELVIVQIDETEFRPIEDILKLEEALTRVQGQKIKAIEVKNRLVAVDEEKNVRIAILQIELQKLQGTAGATESWTDALRKIKERRLAKRAEENADE
jgi:uncharacterized protein YjcR